MKVLSLYLNNICKVWALMFIKGITWERFDELTKPKLIKLDKHLDLELDQVMRMHN